MMKTEMDWCLQVIVRVRPMNKKEESEEAEQVVYRMSSTCVSLADQQFTYDAVAGEDSSQVTPHLAAIDFMFLTIV